MTEHPEIMSMPEPEEIDPLTEAYRNSLYERLSRIEESLYRMTLMVGELLDERKEEPKAESGSVPSNPSPMDGFEGNQVRHVQ